MKVTWSHVTGSGSSPGGRSSHTCDVINRKLYVFGGENTPRVPVDNHMYCCDLDTGVWMILKVSGAAPCGRIAPASAVVGDNVFLHGGRTGVDMGEGSLSDMYRFDPTTLTWTEVRGEGDVPSARSYHAMATRGSQLYLFGGCGVEGRMNDLYRYDIPSNHWTRLPSHPALTGRGGPGLVVMETELYVVSGFAGDETNDMYQFDLESHTWTTLTPDPVFSPRSVFGLCRLGDDLVMFGGEVQPSDLGHAGAGGFTDETWVYSTRSNKCTWVKVKAEGGVTPPARGWFRAAAIAPSGGDVTAPSGGDVTAPPGGEMVIYGGNAADNSRLSDLWILRVER